MVVSVYGEDFRWISSTLAGGGVDSVFIYNKGAEKFGCKDDRVRVIVVPNVGREGETFLRHIIDNYDSLAEGTWFLQGNPFHHCPDLLGLIRSADEYCLLPFKSMSDRYITHRSIPPTRMVEGNDAFRVGGFRCSHYFIKDLQLVGHCAFFDEGMTHHVRSFSRHYGTNDLFGHLSSMIGIEAPKPITEFAYSACFYVSGDSIRRHPKEVYEKTREFLLECHEQGGSQGFILERFWPYLLTGVSYNSLLECYEPIIGNRPVAVWCRLRKRAWIKGVGWGQVNELPSATVFYREGGVLRHLVGIDLVGPDLLSADCKTQKEADKFLLDYIESRGLLL